MQKSPEMPNSKRLSRQRLQIAAGCTVAACCALWFFGGQFFLARKPILVGVLHSQTGPIAVSESAMIDAERLAFEEINAAG